MTRDLEFISAKASNDINRLKDLHLGRQYSLLYTRNGVISNFAGSAENSKTLDELIIDTFELRGDLPESIKYVDVSIMEDNKIFIYFYYTNDLTITFNL